MIFSSRFICVLDANVLYPVEVRDLLLWLAYRNIYTVAWSEDILQEWQEVMRRKGIDEDRIKQRLAALHRGFPKASIENYKLLIPHFNLPDKNDNHVLAAAVKANANLIVTQNLKDFPDKYLLQFGLKAKTADDFVTALIDLNEQEAKSAFLELVANRTSPQQDVFEVLNVFRNNNLVDTANYLHSLI